MGRRCRIRCCGAARCDWDDPEEIIYSREYVLALPEDLAPGEYSLVTGFYQRDTGQRLLSPTGEDALWVTRIEVE